MAAENKYLDILTSKRIDISEVQIKKDQKSFFWSGKYHENMNRRDTLERTIFNYALKSKIPFVGICRGMQMMNVACGGTLYGDIPTQIGNKVTHRNKGEVMHDIYLVDTSSLIFPIKTDTFNVNSWHHQGLNLIADNIRVLARSYDDLPEAVIMKKKIHPYMIAVQFHPERLGNQNIISKTIKNSFYRAIKQHND